jgi:cytoskeletal protein CcmA (bactofilin family)
VGLFGSKDRGDNTPIKDSRESELPADGTQSDSLRSKTRSGAPSKSQSKKARSAPGQTTGAQTTDTRTIPEGEKRMATIGQSIVFKGELTGDEDLEIEGQVDGVVQLVNHQLTIGAGGRLKAEVNAKSIIVIGQVTGNLTATERIEIQATGVVTGDIKAPRLNVQEGAVLNGNIDMSSSSASEIKKPAGQPTTAPAEALKSA